MNAKQFGEKYGKKHVRKISKWYELGYLGNTTKDEKTGIYSIPDDIPLPYAAHSSVTKIPTLWKEIFDAAAKTQSLYASMYPKLQAGVFDRQIQDFVDAKFIRVSKTVSGNSFLELLPAGFEFMNKLTDAQKKEILKKVDKAIVTGCTIAEAFIAAWPYIQAFLTK